LRRILSTFNPLPGISYFPTATYSLVKVRSNACLLLASPAVLPRFSPLQILWICIPL